MWALIFFPVLFLFILLAYKAWLVVSTKVHFYEFSNQRQVIDLNIPSAQRRIPGTVITGSATISWTSGLEKEPRKVLFHRNDYHYYYQAEDSFRNWKAVDGYERFYKVPEQVKKALEDKWTEQNQIDFDESRKSFDKLYANK